MTPPARAGCARKGRDMAKLVFGMNQFLDGYVDHMAFAPWAQSLTQLGLIDEYRVYLH